jgi:hypothetical protein
MEQSRAADLAEQQVAQILAAAEAAAEQIERDALEQAQAELESVRGRVNAELTRARQQAAALEERARERALELEEDSRRQAEWRLGDAERRAAQIGDQTRRSVEGRVDRAEHAGAEMVGHAEALSEGLRRLGELLTEQGERILRDASRARKQLRAQMEAAIEGDGPPPPSRDRPRGAPPKRRRDELAPPAWVDRP